MLCMLISKASLVTMIQKVLSLLFVSLAIVAATADFKRDSWVYRDGSELKIDGKRFTTGGANVYWLVGYSEYSRKGRIV